MCTEVLQLHSKRRLAGPELRASKQYLAACRVGAIVFEAYMAWARTPVAGGGSRVPRGRRTRAPFAPAEIVDHNADPHPVPVPEGLAPPAGVHNLRVEERGGVQCLTCTRCHRTAPSRQQWSQFVGRPCGRGPRPVWRATFHVLVPAPRGNLQCARCGRMVAPRHRARVARTRCPARILAGQPIGSPDWGVEMFRRMGFLSGQPRFRSPANFPCSRTAATATQPQLRTRRRQREEHEPDGAPDRRRQRLAQPPAASVLDLLRRPWAPD